MSFDSSCSSLWGYKTSARTVGFLCHMASLFPVCKDLSMLSPPRAALRCILHGSVCVSPFSASSPAFVTFCVLNPSYSYRGDVIPYCDFNF